MIDYVHIQHCKMNPAESQSVELGRRNSLAATRVEGMDAGETREVFVLNMLFQWFMIVRETCQHSTSRRQPRQLQAGSLACNVSMCLHFWWYCSKINSEAKNMVWQRLFAAGRRGKCFSRLLEGGGSTS